MGAWGTYPKDSDGALDLFGEINDLVSKNFERLSEGYDGYDYAGGIMLLLQKGFHVKRKMVEKALSFVESEMENTKAGKSEWPDPPKAIASMETVINGFIDVLGGENKGAKEILAPIGWLEREGDRKKDNWSGMGFLDM